MAMLQLNGFRPQWFQARSGSVAAFANVAIDLDVGRPNLPTSGAAIGLMADAVQAGRIPAPTFMGANVKPNGRRAWRKWCKRARLHMNKHHRALYRGAIMRKKQPERTSLPTKPLTARSLVGMTMGARKRAAKSEGVRIGCKAGPKICDKLRKRMWRVWAQAPYARTARTEELAKIWQDMYAKYRIGEHLRPCPGCCACWGCEQDLTRVNPVSGNTLHWAGPKRKHTFECSMGPPLAGKKSKHIARMLKWQETLPDDCDGSGVLPARNQK